MLPGFIQRAIQDELAYQDDKFGPDKQQSLPGYFLLMRRELEEAEAAWAKGPWNGRNSAMAELTQVVTLGIRAMLQYGTDGCPAATNDIYNTSNTFKSALDESKTQKSAIEKYADTKDDFYSRVNTINKPNTFFSDTITGSSLNLAGPFVINGDLVVTGKITAGEDVVVDRVAQTPEQSFERISELLSQLFGHLEAK